MLPWARRVMSSALVLAISAKPSCQADMVAISGVVRGVRRSLAQGVVLNTPKQPILPHHQSK
jgi:hypothetical protein